MGRTMLKHLCNCADLDIHRLRRNLQTFCAYFEGKSGNSAYLNSQIYKAESTIIGTRNILATRNAVKHQVRFSPKICNLDRLDYKNWELEKKHLKYFAVKGVYSFKHSKMCF